MKPQISPTSRVSEPDTLFDAPNELFPLLPEGWPRYRPGQFPRAEHLHRHTLKLPVPHDNDDLADAYLQAFTKVLSNYRDLKEAHPV
ncbi:hypothetical protein [Saccharopolyspora spinosa]|uniref:Uncharacterized protein n=1 Tax=Saccharopolyspora spinosa TaxID=60894 RepID=A0A2N3Y1C3_SACSN|nr:hypothetical protein [Saccharopolyspora spinosa]PKW16693.1 hypothetical protein A8926_4557 [Saccharopolyspora spinosa]